jgi:hypothetical protein
MESLENLGKAELNVKKCIQVEGTAGVLGDFADPNMLRISQIPIRPQEMRTKQAWRNCAHEELSQQASVVNESQATAELE